MDGKDAVGTTVHDQGNISWLLYICYLRGKRPVSASAPQLMRGHEE